MEVCDNTHMPDRKNEGGAAVGEYLRTLREASGLTVAEVAARVGIDASQIWRIERGKSDPRASILFRFVAVVNGSVEDVALLINNPRATAEDGERLARLRLGAIV